MVRNPSGWVRALQWNLVILSQTGLASLAVSLCGVPFLWPLALPTFPQHEQYAIVMKGQPPTTSLGRWNQGTTWREEDLTSSPSPKGRE
ncbi:hypothetical protein B0J13DRAFT_540197 [Dactylonectria estremocensis]|uniref:Uncharacterized protein n=1 Tax=Dactylonectria estremocensis TaxID=1079267 RepID=A0A9P9FDW0_9HYPO|nr:hypothetical protein B0J13DRAFT_540197 [Dactylonectria estremocensis]